MINKIKITLLILKTYGIISGFNIILKLVTKNKLILNLPNIQFPFLLRPCTSDFSTFCQIFLYKEYDISLPFIPKIIIDGGANIGLFSIVMKNRFENAKIICIEPDPDNFITLKENIKKYDNIILKKAAIWNKDTKLKLSDKYNLGKWGMIIEEDNSGNVNGLCIKHLIEELHIDFIDILKLDVESSEKYIFSENYEFWLPKCRLIIIELHDRIEKGCSETFFKSINKCFKNYETQISGENIIIINQDLN
jgi:FkbM family methyltransferase